MKRTSTSPPSVSPLPATAASSSTAPSPDIGRRLAAAAAHCRQRGVQLTALRREVLELLWRRNGAAKAYDLQDDLRQRHGRVAPTTVYRALEFLMEQELVHRVDAVNAFVACDIEHGHAHPSLMLVCSRCGRVTEWHDHEALAGLTARLKAQFPGFTEAAIEIKGVCGECAREQAQT